MKKIKISPVASLILATIFFASSCKKENSNEPAGLPAANNQNLSAAQDVGQVEVRPFSDYLDARL